MSRHKSMSPATAALAVQLADEVIPGIFVVRVDSSGADSALRRVKEFRSTNPDDYLFVLGQAPGVSSPVLGEAVARVGAIYLEVPEGEEEFQFLQRISTVLLTEQEHVGDMAVPVVEGRDASLAVSPLPISPDRWRSFVEHAEDFAARWD